MLEYPSHGCIILDAKRKRSNGRPAEADSRQLFAYAHHFEATQVRLLYSQAQAEIAVEGEFTRLLLTAQGLGVIRGGVSYIRVGENSASNEAVSF